MNEAKILELLGNCVSFQSVSGNEASKKECLDWIRNAFFSSVDDKNIHESSVEGAPYLLVFNSDSRLMWFGHIDVVPGKEDQFTLRVDGDRAYGRGAKDMKGAAIPFLCAYKVALDEGVNPPVSILINSDEEIAGPTIPTLLEEGKLKGEIAYTPDSGLENHVVTEHKGVIWCTLKCKGKSSHAAYPWEGENPLDLLSEALILLKKKFPTGTSTDWEITVTPTRIETDTARNQIANMVQCSLDVRYPPEISVNPNDIKDLVAQTLPEGCELEIDTVAKPLFTDPDHPLINLLKKITEEVTGESIGIGREHGASDARYFSEKGIPAFIHGPTGGDIHGKNEWVSVESVIHQYEIWKRILRELS